MTWLYTDENGEDIEVSGEEEYRKLWIDRFLRAGGINPRAFCGGRAIITIEGGQYEDQNCASGNKLLLAYQQHYIRLEGLTVTWLHRDGVAFQPILGSEIELRSPKWTTTSISNIEAEHGYEDVFEEDKSRRGRTYEPRWLMFIHIDEDEGAQDRQTYWVPISLELF
jgi:hypothetical protein